MKTTQVTSIFVLLLLLLIVTGYVWSTPVQGEETVLVPGDERYVQDAHLARYQEHLVNLGIDRFICR